MHEGHWWPPVGPRAASPPGAHRLLPCSLRARQEPAKTRLPQPAPAACCQPQPPPYSAGISNLCQTPELHLRAVISVGGAGDPNWPFCSLLRDETLQNGMLIILHVSFWASLKVNLCTSDWSLMLLSLTVSQRDVVKVQRGQFLYVKIYWCTWTHGEFDETGGRHSLRTDSLATELEGWRCGVGLLALLTPSLLQQTNDTELFLNI